MEQTIKKNNPDKKGKVIKVILVTFVILFALVFFFPNILSLFVKDIAPANDSDLVLKKITIPDSENAYFDTIKAVKKLIAIKEQKGDADNAPDNIYKILSGGEWNNEVAKEFIEQNKEELYYLHSAMNKPFFQDPTYANPQNLPSLGCPAYDGWLFSGMVRPLSINALYLANNGQKKEAIEEAFKTSELGWKIENSQGPIEGNLIGSAMKNAGLQTIQKLIPLFSNSADLIGYTKRLTKLHDDGSGAISAIKYDYREKSLIVDAVFSGNQEALYNLISFLGSQCQDNIEDDPSKSVFPERFIRNDFYFQPNKTKLTLAENARSTIKNIDTAYGEIKEKQISPIEGLKVLFRKNWIGDTIISYVGPSQGQFIYIRALGNSNVATTTTLMAIRAYKIDNNDYPTSLKELIPRYLESVPKDPFDGEDIKYSKDRKVIYSVGSDLNNNGAEQDSNTLKINF